MKRLSEYGPLDISEDYESFLEESRNEFNSLRVQPIHQTVTSTLSDFSVVRYLGRGAFGRIYLVHNKIAKTFHAMKKLVKEEIVKKNYVKLIKYEKIILHLVNFPFLIRLEHYFIDNSFIYFITPFISGGDMYYYIRQAGRFHESLVRFYGAQVVLGLEYLHFLDIVYRDLKPENILVDHTGYVKITDFGFAKKVTHRTYTLCGTPEYMAPEVILGKGYGKAVDWWSFGILLYEMASGNLPFRHNNHLKLYRLAVAPRYKMPENLSSELKHLIDNILQTDLSKRLGNLKDGVKDIKQHKWFRPIIWYCLLNRRMRPPFVPEKNDLFSTRVNGSSGDITFKVESTNRFEQEFKYF